VGVDAWLTLLVILGVLVGLVRSNLSPAVTVFGGTVALLLLGVIDEGQAFSGFSNPAPITVAALYVLAGAVEKTGALAPLTQRTLGSRGWYRRPLLRTLLPTTAASGLLNNTPIVAMLIPQIESWADRRGLSASRLLMPVSFAAILGGTLTLIGTSTNVVVAGQMETLGLQPLGFFEIGAVGAPLVLIGLVYLVAMAPRLLPARRSPMREIEAEAKRFNAEMVVVEGGPVDGLTVEDAKLRSLDGVFLVAVDRGDSIVAPVRPSTVLRGGDRLRFAGPASQMLDLQSRRGLESAELEHVMQVSDPAVRYFEVVVGSRSTLAGSTLADVGFRSRYQAAVVAIHRDGSLVASKLGTVPIRPGDTLIIISDAGFRNRWKDRADFLVVAEIDGTPPQASSNAVWAIGALAAVVIAAATGIVPILQGALVAAIGLVVGGVLTPWEARRSVDLEVITVIASAFGIAAAVQTSGLAEVISTGLVDALDSYGERGVLLGLVLATVLLTEMITNNAAALLMLPVATTAATAAGMDPRGAAVAIAVAASASFLSPIGYQTNMMVYGPGGYRFSDYARLGAPLTVLTVSVVVLLIPFLYA
jgi:di/tricarboxylate transporter